MYDEGFLSYESEAGTDPEKSDKTEKLIVFWEEPLEKIKICRSYIYIKDHDSIASFRQRVRKSYAENETERKKNDSACAVRIDILRHSVCDIVSG